VNLCCILVFAELFGCQGFHTSVGGGGERQTPEWYAEKGIEVNLD
jgi:hypothetical protein